MATIRANTQGQPILARPHGGSPRARGFTLLEAMVALVIVALGMMAVSGQVNRYVVAASLVETKTLASWIATNQITELSVGRQWPELGDSERELEYAGRQWHSDVEVTATDVPNLHRVDISVSLADAPERVLHKVSGLIEPPAPPGFQPVEWSAAPGAPGEGGGPRGTRDGDSDRGDSDRDRDRGDGAQPPEPEQPTEPGRSE